jgi:hypothetical protein
LFTDDVDRFKLVDVLEYEGRTEDELLLFLESMLEQESFLLTFVGLTHSAWCSKSFRIGINSSQNSHGSIALSEFEGTLEIFSFPVSN